MGVTHKECDRRPYEYATDNEPLTAHPVGYNTCKGAYNAIDPKEDCHQSTECFGLIQLTNIYFHSLLHGGQHLSIHVIQECY